MQKPTLLILAAGMGSRYGGLKQIDNIGPSGEAIIDYSIYDAIMAGFAKVVLVIRKAHANDFDKRFARNLDGKIALHYVFQEPDNLPEGFYFPAGRTKPWGTAHAIMVAESAIDEPFMVVNADDFYGRETFISIYNYLKSNTNRQQHCMVGFRLNNTLSEFGPVSRGICQIDQRQNLTKITEITNIARKDGTVGYTDFSGNWTPLDENLLVSMNAWGFYPEIFAKLRNGLAQFLGKLNNIRYGEYFISMPLNDMLASNTDTISMLETSSQWFGLTYPDDKLRAAQKLKALIDEGIYPLNLWS
jgi:NDP-sugar pyrophosphorylase family protein